MKSCFFIGHRQTPGEVFPFLYEAIEKHITEYGVTRFIVGRYGEFDGLTARALRDAKEIYPQIKLSLLLPYHPVERPIETPRGFDDTWYPDRQERVPRKAAIVRANRYAVDHVDYLITYMRHSASNTCELVRYAHLREEKGLLRVTRL